MAQAGLADAGDLAAFACHRAFYAGVQRLQAVDRAAGAGHAAAQRDRKILGGAGVFAYHLPESRQDEVVFHRRCAVCADSGRRHGAHAAGAAPVRHAADPVHRRGADVCGRHGAAMVRAGRGAGRGGHCGGGHCAAGAGALRHGPARVVARPLRRPAGGGPPDDPEPLRHRVGRAGRAGAGQQPTEISVRAGAAERLYFFDFVRGAWFYRGSAGRGAVFAAAAARHVDCGARAG